MSSTNSIDSLIEQKIVNQCIDTQFNCSILQQVNISQQENIDIENQYEYSDYDHLQKRSDQQQLELDYMKSTINSNNESITQTKNRKEQKFQQVKYSIVDLNERYVPLIIPTHIKCFLLTGGIIIELEKLNKFDVNSLSSSKSISKIQKYKNGCIAIDVAIRQQLKKFDHVIYILEQSQNQDNYNLAQKLRAFQMPIYNINSTIERIKLSFDNEQLFQIIEERKQYFQKFQQQCVQKYLKDEEFSSMVAFQIDWSIESMTLSNFLLSKAIIALIGTVNEEMVSFLFRNGFFQMFNYQSRRRILDLSLKFYTYPQSQQIIYEDILDFELYTLDNIHIKCNAQLQRISFQYPYHLQFNDETNSNINNIESVSILKYDITQDILINIINLRQQMINQQNSIFYQQLKTSNVQESENLSQNFEYYMQSEIFLQKFYKDKYEQFTKDKRTCKYRTIHNQNINHHQNYS